MKFCAEEYTQGQLRKFMNNRNLMRDLAVSGLELKREDIHKLIVDYYEQMESYADHFEQSAIFLAKQKLYKWMAQFIDEKGTWLDLGFGAGHLIHEVSPSQTTVGVDINPWMVEKARTRLKGRDLSMYVSSELSISLEEGVHQLPDNKLKGEIVKQSAINLVLDSYVSFSEWPGPLQIIRSSEWRPEIITYSLAGGTNSFGLYRPNLVKEAIQAAAIMLKPGGIFYFFQRKPESECKKQIGQKNSNFFLIRQESLGRYYEPPRESYKAGTHNGETIDQFILMAYKLERI